jgi:hypothetical protein
VSHQSDRKGTGIRLFGRRFLKTYPYSDGYFLPDARQVRAAVGLPMVLLGGVTSRAVIDQAMAEGFQFVAMGRALLREPDLVHRMQQEPGTRSLCIHCNKCMTTIFASGTRCVLVPPPPGLAPAPDRNGGTSAGSPGDVALLPAIGAAKCQQPVRHESDQAHLLQRGRSCLSSAPTSMVPSPVSGT